MECEGLDCNGTLQELDSFLDDEMPDDARAAIRHHLDGCPDCLSAFDFHAELKSIIHEKCHNEEMPPGLLGRIEACFQTDIDGNGIIGSAG